MVVVGKPSLSFLEIRAVLCYIIVAVNPALV
jgi:hypothetical protein